MSFKKESIIELISLSKNFGDNILLDDVSFKVNKGEITTLIGQNGAGKTTLAKIILKLESYDRGDLKIRKNLRIGYVPQSLDFSSALPLTAKCLLKILSPSEFNKKIASFSNFINYDLIKRKDISDLSGGQLQKLILAGTLMNEPELVILDEPTQFLDVSSQQEFYHLLNQLKKENDLTVFMISHDLFTVMKNSDQVICLNKHVCCTGRPTELDNNIVFKNALSEIGVYIHNHDHKH